MPSRQAEDVGEGEGAPLAGVLGARLGEVDGLPDGEPLGPPVGEPDALRPAVGLAGELVPGWPEGLVDAFFPDRVVAAPGVVAPPGTPLAGPVVRALADVLGDGTRLAVPVPAVEGPAGRWFAAGVPLSAPERSSAMRPPLARTAAPIAKAPTRRRGDRSG
jgi:hypothetical protein